MNTLTKTQKVILGLAIVPMIAVSVAGGIGSYSNISHAYGSGTALGALAAGEGATAVLAMILLGLTLLGQSSPRAVRLGLWALPMTAAVMGATAAREGLGQTIVFAITPLAITAGAEGLAFLVRRIVVHQVGRDIEAEARAAQVIRELAYQQARAASHPSDRIRKRSVRRSWRLARMVGTGDVQLGGQLIDVQRTRLVAGADMALERMFTPGLTATRPELPATPEQIPAALPASTPTIPVLSAGDAMEPRRSDVTIPAETSGYPIGNESEQVSEGANVVSIRKAAKDARADDQEEDQEGESRPPSIRSAVLKMASAGLTDLDYLVKSVAALHGRNADDPKLTATVKRYVREATQPPAGAPEDQGIGGYM
jgi:hypothetical protein